MSFCRNRNVNFPKIRKAYAVENCKHTCSRNIISKQQEETLAPKGEVVCKFVNQKLQNVKRTKDDWLQIAECGDIVITILIFPS